MGNVKIQKLFSITFLLLISFFVYAEDLYTAKEYSPTLEYKPKNLYSNTDSNHSSAAIYKVNPNEVESKAINENLAVNNFSEEKKNSSLDGISKTAPSAEKSIFENKETDMARNNNIILTLLGICVVGILLFIKKSIQNKKLGQASNENIFEGITGVEKYISKLNSNKTGVTKYLEKQQQMTQLTGVAKAAIRNTTQI